MSELLQELEDDLRQERWMHLWKRTGKVLVGISVAIVLATAAYEALEYRHQSVSMERTELYLKGLERMKLQDAKGALEQFDKLAADTSSPYYPLAMLRKAQVYVARGEKDKAIETYKTLAQKEDAYGQLAKLYASADGKPVVAPADRTSPFYYSLRELQGWQLVEQGKKDEAVALFAELYEDLSAPPSLHARLREALLQLAPEKLL
jgi:hypothetical protein